MKENTTKSMVITCIMILSFCFPSLATNYYVNDAVPADPNDVFTTGAGAPANPGTQAQPKESIQSVVDLGLVAGDTVFIDAGLYDEQVWLSGLSGTSTLHIVFIGAGAAFTTIQKIFSPVPANPNAIHMINCNFIKWQDVKVITNQWAFHLINRCTYNTISRCEVIAGLYAVDIHRTNGAGNIPTNNTVENCLLNSSYVGIRIKTDSYGGGGGWANVALTGPIDNIVRDNTVLMSVTPEGVPFAALELQACRANYIHRNTFSLTGNNASTGGTVYLNHFNANIVLENNYILNHTTQYNANARPNPGIMIDDNSSASFVHNSVYAVNNAFHFNDDANLRSLENISLYNNIFQSTVRSSIYIRKRGVSTPNIRFGNCNGNLYYAPSGSVATIFAPDDGATTTNYTLATWRTYDPDLGPGNELNGFNANPDYSNPAANILDLNSSSAAIDVADVVTVVSDDRYRTGRPQGPKKDIGAFETVVLPIRLLHFGVSCSDGKIDITWVTLSETNNDYFAIEKSTDLKTFSDVTVLKGSGTTLQRNTYHYTDDFSVQNVYYRLRQVDLDGQYSYSPIVYSNCTSQQVLVAQHEGHLELIYPEAVAGETIEVTLLSTTGQEILRKEMPLSSAGSILLDTSSLSSSLYILCAKKGWEIFTTKIIVQQ